MIGKGRIGMKSISVEEKELVPIKDKYLLTIREAGAYFNLGIKKLRRMAEDNTDNFSIYNGSRYMIIRHKLEKYLEETSSI